MPTISRFFGIIISMHPSDHPPPHFHAQYAEDEALIRVKAERTPTGQNIPGFSPAQEDEKF